MHRIMLLAVAGLMLLLLSVAGCGKKYEASVQDTTAEVLFVGDCWTGMDRKIVTATIEFEVDDNGRGLLVRRFVDDVAHGKFLGLVKGQKVQARITRDVDGSIACIDIGDKPI